MHLQDRATGGILLAASGAGIASLVVGATSKPNVGPWLALAGALLVAVLTAVFTRARQRTELDAADRRQRAALTLRIVGSTRHSTRKTVATGQR